MGDLVDSERSPSVAVLHTTFNTAVTTINQHDAASLVSPLTITLGDEFQGLASTLTVAAQIARKLRVDLMSADIDCRFVIGLATIETPVNHRQAWNMMGPGLATARAALNEKSGVSYYRFSLPDEPIHETTLNSLGAAISAIERRWTARQRDEIIASLGGENAAEIARRRNISVHSIYKVRSAGHLDLYRMHWHAINLTLAHLDRRYGLT